MNIMDKLLKNQLLKDLQNKGCTDRGLALSCINQSIAAQDILSGYSESLCYALSLYEASMWGRRKSNDCVHQERQRREKLLFQSAPCLSARIEPGPDEIRVGRLILRRRQ